MITTHSSEPFPDELRQQLGLVEEKPFARTAVLIREPFSGLWKILGCVLRPIENGVPHVDVVTYEYKNAVLVCDVLEASQCISFLEGLARPGLTIAARTVEFEAYSRAEIIKVGLQNHWMEKAGTVYVFSSKNDNPVSQERLLQPGNPYYPDPYEAAKDWLGLRVYHGSSDGNNGKVLVLLPETQGFIDDFSWSNDTLELHIAGTANCSENLQVLGAFWSPAGMEQLAANVTVGRASLQIAPDAHRLEIFVAGSSGGFFEYHYEQLGYGLEGCRFLGARSHIGDSATLVTDSVAKGECVDVEFKAWVDTEGQLKENSKLMQVLQTAAAFANTSGGTVYIGVDDHSEVIGINTELAKSVKGPADERGALQYLGTLRSRINDGLRGPVALTTSLAEIGGKFVAMLHVASCQSPVSIGTQYIFYARKGATNVKVPPDEWLARTVKPALVS